MRIKLILSVSAILLLTFACKKKGCMDESAENYNSSAQKDDGSCSYSPSYLSEFTFMHEINGDSFLFDTLLYLHPAGQTFSVQTLKYFISNLVLYKSNGDSVYLDMTHYVDAKNASSSTFKYAQSIENTNYIGIAFIFGLDPSKNVSGAFNNPPESLMEWSVPMGGGYHYMKLEGKYDSLGLIKNYNIQVL